MRLRLERQLVKFPQLVGVRTSIGMPGGCESEKLVFEMPVFVHFSRVPLVAIERQVHWIASASTFL